MNANIKNTKMILDENFFWISKEMNCISFKNIQGYKKIEFSNKEEMWSIIHQLVDVGYQVR